MQLTKIVRHLLVLSPLVLIPIVYAVTSDQAQPESQTLSPLKEHSNTSKEILKQLNEFHYKDVAINDDLSETLLDTYIEALDGTKSYFLKSDIESFEKYRYTLDDSLQQGDLDPAFDIFNRLQKRRLDRFEFILEAIKSVEKIDFTLDDSLETNREDTQWLRDIKESNQFWQKRLKSEVLSLKLTDEKISDIKDTLNKRYKNQLFRAKQVNAADAFGIYMNTFAHMYDPHTDYFPPRAAERFNINMRLSLEGIGAILQQEGEYTKVIRLVPAGPADKSNVLHPADKIVGVAQGKNGEMIDIVGWRLDDAVDIIRGPKGSIAKLKIMPANAPNDETKIIHIIREKVKLEEQAAQKKIIRLEKNGQPFALGIITLPTFYMDFAAAQAGDPNFRSSTRDVKRLLDELKAEGIDALAIDLRNNGGGSLDEANRLTGLFIPTGPVVQIRYRSDKIQTMGDSDPSLAYNGPLAVLVNRLSASASEIFAGAIQDFGRGIIVGEQTFGKGTVQTMNSIQSGQLKYTQAKFYRISGDSTQHKGVIPDISYPSLIDKEKIGEDTRDNALPWDKIKATRYGSDLAIQGYTPILRRQHKQRIESNPEFSYLIQQVALAQKVSNDTLVSLNEQKRVEESESMKQQQLDYTNKLLKSRNKKPADKLEVAGQLLATDILLEDVHQLFVDHIKTPQDIRKKFGVTIKLESIDNLINNRKKEPESTSDGIQITTADLEILLKESEQTFDDAKNLLGVKITLGDVQTLVEESTNLEDAQKLLGTELTLNQVNKLLALHTYKTAKTLDEAKKAFEQDERDPLLRETGRIMHDLISFNKAKAGIAKDIINHL